MSGGRWWVLIAFAFVGGWICGIRDGIEDLRVCKALVYWARQERNSCERNLALCHIPPEARTGDRVRIQPVEWPEN